MRQKNRNDFRAVLLAVRAKLLGDTNSLQDSALSKTRSDSSGDLSAMPIHFADIGSDTFDQEFSLDLLSNEQDMLVEINDALDRLADKQFGNCEECGEKIAMNRLKALPYARFCITCQRKTEEQKNS